jgi:SAM-dependent methyltransferase
MMQAGSLEPNAIAKRGALERRLVGMRSEDVRYPIVRAHFDWLSGAVDRAAREFRTYVAAAAEQLAASRPAMNDVAEAVFCMNDLRPLEDLLKLQHGSAVRLVLGREEEPDNASIVLWSLEPDGGSTFRFSESLSNHPYSAVLLKHWIQEVPLLTNFARANTLGQGRTWLNVGDLGSVSGLAYCDYRQGYYLLPDPIYMQTCAYADAKATFVGKPIPWASRKSIAFWRGQTTGWYDAQGNKVRSWGELPRVQLCRLAQSNAADLLDAGLSGLAQVTDEEQREVIQGEGLLKNHVHWSEFQRWKFQIDIDGNTNAWPGMFIKLYSGSPILKVTSPLGFRQWYYDRLTPWKNFVPVEADMSDLLEKIAWLQAHDEHAWQIGETARQLAISMTVEREMDRAMPAITKALWPSAESTSGSGYRFKSTSELAGSERNVSSVRRFGELDNATLEQEALEARVRDLSERNETVKLHLGPGPTPKVGFINIDKFKNVENRGFFDRYPQDYVVYPFAERSWPLPDCSVDYIYHEDFIEHVPQKNQFLVLAEALRVLKPGGIHRISTPCLIQSMRTHSNFMLGFAGVHVDEWDRWGHAALLSRASLEEMALVVGYRCVYFTAKSKSMSPFASDDSRPHADRDQVLGNVFADLLK